jgi:hypothetical protein
MTPETEALVQRLKRHEFLLRAVERKAEANDIMAAIAALSQERACSTCKWCHRSEGEIFCDHSGSGALELSSPQIDTWGCLLWEQADPKESA